MKKFIIDDILGGHSSCNLGRRQALSLSSLSSVPSISAHLLQQTQAVTNNQLSTKTLQALAATEGISLTPSQATRLKQENTRRLDLETARACQEIDWWARQLVVGNKGTVAILQFYEPSSKRNYWRTYSTNKDSGELDVAGNLPAVVTLLLLVSHFYIPAYALDLFAFCCATTAADFARMFHVNDVDAKTMVFLWNTQLNGRNVALMFGQYLGNEDSEMWEYCRKVRLCLPLFFLKS